MQHGSSVRCEEIKLTKGRVLFSNILPCKKTTLVPTKQGQPLKQPRVMCHTVVVLPLAVQRCKANRQTFPGSGWVVVEECATTLSWGVDAMQLSVHLCSLLPVLLSA